MILSLLIDPSGELLGYEKTRSLFTEAAGEPPADLIERLADAAADFAGGRTREDDVTLVALRATFTDVAEVLQS